MLRNLLRICSRLRWPVRAAGPGPKSSSNASAKQTPSPSSRSSTNPVPTGRPRRRFTRTVNWAGRKQRRRGLFG
ncbi:hypothetical protein M0R45_010952 [Rubus argutus]|uniref:Secreted protein n=1 Tax=Rubus argutus TaxID=59490 RepID=A0AAW1YBM5_RUBAR